MSSGDKPEAGTPERPRRGPRFLAEWLTFALCSALVLALAANLAWRLREPASDIAFARAAARLEALEERGGRYVLPIELHNPSRRTLRDVQLRVRYPGPDGGRESLDVLVDYLGPSSSETVYVYLRADPRGAAVDAEPIAYRLD